MGIHLSRNFHRISPLHPDVCPHVPSSCPQHAVMAIKMLKDLFPARHLKFGDEHPTVHVGKLQGSGSKGGGDGSEG